VFDHLGRRREGGVLAFEILFRHRTGGSAWSSYIEAAAAPDYVSNHLADVRKANADDGVGDLSLYQRDRLAREEYLRLVAGL
jgi:hypothetical protein